MFIFRNIFCLYSDESPIIIVTVFLFDCRERRCNFSVNPYPRFAKRRASRFTLEKYVCFTAMYKDTQRLILTKSLTFCIFVIILIIIKKQPMYLSEKKNCFLLASHYGMAEFEHRFLFVHKYDNILIFPVNYWCQLHSH